MSQTHDIRDARFARLIMADAKPEQLWTGGLWVEGPVYVPAMRCVIWSDIPNNRLLRYDEISGQAGEFEKPCGFHNGHSLDHQGRILACEHARRCISRRTADGRWEALATHWQGKRLNSPNDIIEARDGTIWFTDPTYGIDSDYEGYKAESEIGRSQVYRLKPGSDAPEAIITTMVKPNGLAFSPDESVLYVSETGGTHVAGLASVIRAFDAQSLLPGAEGRILATSPNGYYDGFRVDVDGNIWTSAGDGVYVYAPDGTHLGTIRIPETVANLTFGGPERKHLYITAKSSLYVVPVNTTPAAGP